MYKSALILAAGQGTRIKSDLPKVLHKVCGKEMVNHVIDTLRNSDVQDINVVVGKGAELVKERTKSRNVSYSVQSEQLGTGHAVKCAKDFLKGKKGVVAVFCGDSPLITNETINSLMKSHIENKNSITVLTTVIDDATGYGRIVREGDSILKIVEHKDCNNEELLIKEINSGVYCFDIENLLDSLEKISNNNSQKEYYLTDVVGIQKNENKKVGVAFANYEEIIGVNSRVQLAQVESIMRNRINTFHMNNGVTLINPQDTYIGADVSIGKDTIIYPGNIIEGNSEIGENCLLYPNCRVKDSIIGSDVTVESSVVLESRIGNKTTVGPYAYIRPETVVGDNVRIGDFVELKKSTIGDNTKVSHLTYVGDAEVGMGCNFGCGTVTVNYDGKTKSKTIIGDNSFIGCNTNLIAPVKVEDNTYIAAGSTITEDVKNGQLAIARSRQVNKDGWVNKRKATK